MAHKRSLGKTPEACGGIPAFRDVSIIRFSESETNVRFRLLDTELSVYFDRLILR
jgi:hypothetical protein